MRRIRPRLFAALAVILLATTAETCEPPPTTTTTTTSTTTTTTPPPTGPNILVVMTDDQGCDMHFTTLCDQVEANMPFLRSLPGGSWWTSEQTLTHTSLCCPARATFLTGLTSAHNGQFGNSAKGSWALPEGGNEQQTLPCVLEGAGYATGLFGKYMNWYNGSYIAPCWDRWAAHVSLPQGFNFDVNDQGSVYTVPKTDDSSWDGYWFKDRLIPWINEQDGPWFAFYTPYAPHSGSGAPANASGHQLPVPPLTPNGWEGCPGATDPDISDKPSFVQDNPCGTAKRSNGGQGQWGVDYALSQIYANLQATGELEDTIIVFMSDNGMALHSHRVGAKQCAYVECHTPPLMIRWPGTAGGELDRMISNVDLMPTLLDAAGAPTSLTLDGASFKPMITGGLAGWRSDQWLHNGPPGGNDPSDYDTLADDCVVTTPCYWYTEYANGERELFDLTADPFQLTNLLPNPTTGYAGQPGWDDNHPVVIDVKARLAAHKAAGA